MKNKYKLLIIAFFFASSVLAIISFSEWYVVDVQSTGMDFRVLGPKRAGFNIDADAIHFGIIPPGSASERGITIQNSYSFPVFVDIKLSGETKEYIYSDLNKFVLQPETNKSVTFSAVVPEDIEYGNYSGKMSVYYKRAIFQKLNLF